MNLPDTIYAHARRLPPDLQREALAFIASLETRHRIQSSRIGRLGTEDFLRQFAGCLGADFPDDIVQPDAAADAPRETWS